ncbi:hypothetical protein E4U50_005621 [Claviceps purpurea]|nr:hypothetical protein E4U50_005621 [Claviceps purpurea]
MGSQSPSDMGNPYAPLLHWMDNTIMPYAEALPVFQHPDGQFYPLGMEMPTYDGEGGDYISESYLASSFCAPVRVDSGSPSREMDYISEPQIIHSINHANTDYTDSQSEVSFDYSGFLLLGPSWPGRLASRAQQFLEISSQRPEPIADPHLSWPGSYMDPSMSPGVGTSSLSIPSPDAGSLLLGMPPPGIDSAPSSMPSLSRSPHTEDNMNQSSTAQPSYAGQSPQVQRDYLYSPSPVSAQPAITSAKEYQDQVLMQDRRNGWSYKQIKTIRNFGVSESTLRGRHRTLLKGSHQRPRKPIWTLADVELLKIAVPRSTYAAGSRRVSWKAVSEFIHTNGDSPYAFAYATCHKKWLDLIRLGHVTPNV